MPSLLDLFCGVGGWSDGFQAEGWEVTGVDIEAVGYSGKFIQADVRSLTSGFIDSFDAVTASPPCEGFAKAWLPWLRGDHKPDAMSLELLQWSVEICRAKPNRICECSLFAARHQAGSIRCGSYALWGDIPLLLPTPPREKARKSGKKPEERARIPFELSVTVARAFNLRKKS